MDINTCLATTESYRTLAYFSHIVPLASILILATFTAVKMRFEYKSSIFFTFALSFSLWLTLDLANWLTNDYFILASTWAPLDYVNIVFFLILTIFVYSDLLKRPASKWLIGVVFAAVAAPFLITLSGNSVFELYQPQCEMLGNGTLGLYKLIAEFACLAYVVFIGYSHFRKITNDSQERFRTILVSGSIFLFLGIFSLTEYYSSITGIYEITMYALFVLPIFVLVLTVLITSFNSFNLEGWGIKILFYIFLILAGTQFFFVQNILDFLLAAMSFFVILVLGLVLYHLSEKLQEANQNQESLLHFIGHEVKHYLTIGNSGFANIADNSYGVIPETVKEYATSAQREIGEGIDMTTNILEASNLKGGSMSFDNEPYDLGAVVAEAVAVFRPKCVKAGLELIESLPQGEVVVRGDKAKMSRHVVRNLIENAVQYTKVGSITVSLKVNTKTRQVQFSVTDTGIGIPDHDRARLFTAGGRGRDSIKTNVHSTGFGLFIAKGVVDAHHGTITLSSPGVGKGSTFTVTLPISA